MSKPTNPRTKSQLNRAQLKAYEARRAEEVQQRVEATAERESMAGAATVAVKPSAVGRRRVYALSHEEEMAIIRSDLKRLLTILAILLVVLAIATVLLG